MVCVVPGEDSAERITKPPWGMPWWSRASSSALRKVTVVSKGSK